MGGKDFMPDLINVLAILGFIITVSSLIYAIYTRKINEHKKQLVIEILPRIPVAEVVSGHKDFSLKVVYQKSEQVTEYIDQAFIYYVRIANLGRKPILHNDIAPNDPLVLTCDGGKILDVSLCSVTRDVCNIKPIDHEIDFTQNTVDIDFDFLDYEDGFILQILCDSNDLVINLNGTIIGMPQGILKTKEVSQTQSVSVLGCLIPLAISLISLFSTPFIYHNITGSWTNVWLIGLPVASLLVPYLILILICLIVLKAKLKVKFPTSLMPPGWYSVRLRFRKNRFPE